MLLHEGKRDVGVVVTKPLQTKVGAGVISQTFQLPCQRRQDNLNERRNVSNMLLPVRPRNFPKL